MSTPLAAYEQNTGSRQLKVDAPITADMHKIPEQARRIEALGYSGIKLPELNQDPFMPLAIAAEHTNRAELVTSVAVAFSRNPMTMAQQAHDLNAFSDGRFVLGLGSQVKAHITRRFSMPWHKAAAQMRDFIGAMNAIYDCWYEGAHLNYEGEYYQHTLMPQTFTPKNLSAGRPKIVLSATGPLMTKVAAEVADGMMMHPFSSEAYMQEVTLPAITSGLARSNRTFAQFELDYAPIIATGIDAQSLAESTQSARERIAFYGSTEAYKPVLDQHGWGDLQGELHRLNKLRQTANAAALIDDEILNTIAIVGEPSEVVSKLRNRLGGIVSRTGFAVNGMNDDDLAEHLAALTH